MCRRPKSNLFRYGQGWSRESQHFPEIQGNQECKNTYEDYCYKEAQNIGRVFLRTHAPVEAGATVEYCCECQGQIGNAQPPLWPQAANFVMEQQVSTKEGDTEEVEEEGGEGVEVFRHISILYFFSH